jgi:ubiquitin carboxyl-terminal hydrolase 14
MVSIKLKWNKLSYDDVSIDPSQGVAAFKQKVYELTSVPIDRQKLMAKGAWTGTLKDDADLSQLNIKDGQQVMLMGTAEVVEAPKEAVVFIEDMSSAQKAEQGVVVSAGLRNMGNTCYMNSTVQCIRHMPELREALQPLTAANAQGSGARFAAILKDLYRTLDTSGDPVYPVSFVNTLRLQFPQFAQTGQHGHFLQQDAEEFLNVLVQSLREGLSGIAADYDPLLGTLHIKSSTSLTSLYALNIIRITHPTCLLLVHTLNSCCCHHRNTSFAYACFLFLLFLPLFFVFVLTPSSFHF